MGGIQGNDLAMVDDRHPVTQALGFFHEMGGQEDGLALCLDLLNLVPHRPPGLRVQPGGQLIQEEDLRVIDHGQRDENALLLPSGEL